jgi:hypothetical protein
MFRFLLFTFIALFISTHLWSQVKDNKIASKLSYALQKELAINKNEDSIDLILSVNEIYKSNKQSRTLYNYPTANALVVRTLRKNITALINDEGIHFLDVKRIPKEELTTGAFDLSANRINAVHHQYPSLNGNSIKASIKEQRFDTMDIDFKGRYFNSTMSAATSSSHASIMATILSGGGNSSYYSKGAAWGALITSSSFLNLLPDPDSVYRKYNISIQNHSYGTSIENFYGIDAAAYDVNVLKNNTLLHIFSAGNAGSLSSASGIYAGIQGFATITGSFKMAKNTIAVGHIDSMYNIPLFSSKGPAYDGRVKPELVAFGEDGSSGAAALVSGTVTLLQDLYFKTFNKLPTASLLKAAIINSAEDVGEKGIDFSSGYGSINAIDAVKTIIENRFFEEELSTNETKTFTLAIPANVAQLKVTLAWTDTAATVNSGKALVNDLDASIKQAATGQVWLPWTLNTYPSKDSLLLAAQRKKDTLNNVEQITIDNPAAGNYILEIKGSSIKTLGQLFSIAYQFDTAGAFKFTYPTGSDVIAANSTNIIRWQSTSKENGIIEYTNNGVNWQSISTVDSSKQFVKWVTPDTTTTYILRARMSISNKVFVSDTFVVSKPTSLNVGFNCTDSFLLFWKNHSANHYKLYQLGNKYLEPILQTSDTARIFNKADFPSMYYSAAPIVKNKMGLRSYAIDYSKQGVGCYLRTFFASLENNRALLDASLGSIYDVASISFNKITPLGIKLVQSFNQPTAISLSAVDQSLTSGLNTYQLIIKLKNGGLVTSPLETVYYFPDKPVIIYPNPAQQSEPIKLIVNLPFTYSIQIYDMMGKLVRKKTLEAFTSSLEPFTLSKGLYIIKVSTAAGKLFTQKLVVQ